VKGGTSWFTVLVLLLTALLALSCVGALFLIPGVRQDLVNTVAHIIWIAGLVVQSTPQVIFWGALIFVVLVVALRSLWSTEGGAGLAARPHGRVNRRVRLDFWALQLRISRGRYARSRFGDLFNRLMLDVLAHQYDLPVRAVDRAILSGSIEVPEVVMRFKAARTEEIRPPVEFWEALRLWLERLFAPRTNEEPGFSAQDLESIVRYLEDQLEVENDRRNS